MKNKETDIEILEEQENFSMEEIESIRKKKRRVGRPKKRGPKKKRKRPKKKTYKPRRQIDFKIVLCHNHKQKGVVGWYSSIGEAYEAFNELKKESDNVIFPQRILNNAEIEECNDEYILLEKNRDGSKKNSDIRNDYGKLVPHITNITKWVIIDKCRCETEETFWIWGKHPRADRKDFQWIYDNIIGTDEMLRVMLYKNKVLFKPDDGKMTMVVCKTLSDAIRLYNLLNETTARDKKKNIFYFGRCDVPGDRKRQTEDEIMDLTGWSRDKVQQSFSKKHSKN